MSQLNLLLNELEDYRTGLPLCARESASSDSTKATRRRPQCFFHQTRSCRDWLNVEITRLIGSTSSSNSVGHLDKACFNAKNQKTLNGLICSLRSIIV